MGYDYYVRLIDLPGTVKSFVRINDDSTATVIINARLSREQQLKQYRHEVMHCTENDFEKQDADRIELEAHRGMP